MSDYLSLSPHPISPVRLPADLTADAYGLAVVVPQRFTLAATVYIGANVEVEVVDVFTAVYVGDEAGVAAGPWAEPGCR